MASVIVFCFTIRLNKECTSLDHQFFMILFRLIAYFVCSPYLHVEQKQTLGEVGTGNVNGHMIAIGQLCQEY